MKNARTSMDASFRVATSVDVPAMAACRLSDPAVGGTDMPESLSHRFRSRREQ
jgi:hypothetical protein